MEHPKDTPDQRSSKPTSQIKQKKEQNAASLMTKGRQKKEDEAKKSKQPFRPLKIGKNNERFSGRKIKFGNKIEHIGKQIKKSSLLACDTPGGNYTDGCRGKKGRNTMRMSEDTWIVEKISNWNGRTDCAQMEDSLNTGSTNISHKEMSNQEHVDSSAHIITTKLLTEHLTEEPDLSTIEQKQQKKRKIYVSPLDAEPDLSTKKKKKFASTQLTKETAHSTSGPKQQKKKKVLRDGQENGQEEVNDLQNTSAVKCERIPETPNTSKEHKHSRTDLPILHPSCTNNDNKIKILACWNHPGKQDVTLDEGKIEVIKQPFTCCYVQNLLENEHFLEGVKEELQHIDLHFKNNDLYKFHQTGDLKGVTSPFLSTLRDLLYSDIRQWLIEVTGIPLSDAVDMSSSKYSHTDVLLCHDDELEGRRIAYILYLVPPWTHNDGGSLDLFSTDDSGRPSEIVRSLLPKNNGFAFFEVSPVSFHQVSEVVSEHKTRLSINGWFHGPQRRPPPPPPSPQRPINIEEVEFYTWINPKYIDMKIQKHIRHRFCEGSEIKLENFLTDEAYQKLSEAFRNTSLPWQSVGPADRQKYQVLSPASVSGDIKECQRFLNSEAMFLVLSQLTGLKLHRLAPEDSDEEPQDAVHEPNPRMHTEAQCWGPGCYTLVRDDCVEGTDALDSLLYVNVSQRWTQELGGHVTYIAKDEDGELLTVVPQSNCLCLVYRDGQTLRFTKYINSTAKQLGEDDSHFHTLASTYYE